MNCDKKQSELGSKKLSSKLTTLQGNLNGVKVNVLDYDIIVVIYEALCFDVAQGQINGAPNET